MHKTRQNKKRSYKKRTGDLWNTRREIQTQIKLDQQSWKNGQHQTSETRPQLQNLEEEEIVDALGNDDNVSMPEQVHRPNPWRRRMMIFWITSPDADSTGGKPKQILSCLLISIGTNSDQI